MHRTRWPAAFAVLALGALVLAAPSSGRLQLPMASPDSVVDAAGGRNPKLLPINPLPASIQVIGEVVGHGGATTGTITVHVGAAASDTVGSISPQFSATVSGAQARDMVTLEVQGAGFTYVSLLGTYGKLVRQAGPDQVLTLAESDALRVSPLSTALQFFIAREIGGVPASDVQLENAIRGVQGEDVAVAAALLQEWATGSAELPQGWIDGYALLQDRQAYRDHVAEANYSAYTGDIVEVLSSMPFTGFEAADLRRTVATVGAIADLDAPVQAPRVAVLEPSSGGYLLHHPDGQDPRSTGGLDASGTLSLEPVAENYSDVWSVCPDTNASMTIRTYMRRVSHRLMRRGDRVELRLRVYEYERVPLNCPGMPTTTFKRASLGATVDLGRAVPPAKPRISSGLRALPYFCLLSDEARSYLYACEYALYRFASGGSGTVLELGAKVDDAMEPITPAGQAGFSWSTTRSFMTVHTDVASTRYWLVDEGDGIASGMVYVAEAPLGDATQTICGYAPMLRSDASSGFDDLGVLGNWTSSTYEQWFEPYAYTRQTSAPVVSLQRVADATTRMSFEFPHFPEAGYEKALGRQLRPGGMYETRVVSDDWQYYRDCDEALDAGAQACAPYEVRYFRPLARSGNRLYGLEETYLNLVVSFEPPYEFSRSSYPAYQELH